MDKKCASCGKRFMARRGTAKFCGEACRKRAQRRSTRATPPDSDAAEPDFPISLLASTLTELAKVGRENTPGGQSALLLAYRLERSQGDTGSSVAAMVKQHEATLAEALKSAETSSVVDALRARRDAKRSDGRRSRR